MPALPFSVVKKAIGLFVPESMRENPFVGALLAGAAATVILLALPAFAPVGVVGATGWLIVHTVTGGTLSLQMVRKVYKARRKLGKDKRKDLDDELARLKRAKDDGAISEDEYKERARSLLDKALNR